MARRRASGTAGTARCLVNVTFLTPTRLWLLLQGHPGLLELTEKAQWLVVSVINILEFLGFSGLSDSDRDLFAKFVSRVSVVDLVSGNGALMAAIADLRKRKAVKLPDVIVVASAALCYVYRIRGSKVG